MKIESFRDLIAWQKGHVLVLSIYQITSNLPKEEKYGLVDQLRRASVSVTSNIAEGFSRRTNSDKNHFYMMSVGSIAELQNQLEICKDLGYIAKHEYDKLLLYSVEVKRLLYGLIKSSQTRP